MCTLILHKNKDMMYTKEKPEIRFYQNLGKLFYAIAAADKVVRKVEFDALKKLVLDYWKNLEDTKDDYQESVAYQMEIVFDWFDYEQMDAAYCFNSFSDYVKGYPKAFSEEKRSLIFKTAEAIASSFSGKNKSELIMLTKLELLFKKIKPINA